MAVSTYIITTEDFQSRADLSENILTAKIQAQIGPVQDAYAIKILCNEFYAEVLASISGPAVVVITTLLPFLKDFLVYKTYAEYLVTAPIMMTASGQRTQVDTTSDIASPDLIGGQIAQAERRANLYQDRLVNFLTLNAEDYPTWRDSQCGCNPNLRTINNNQFSIVGKSRSETPIEWT